MPMVNQWEGHMENSKCEGFQSSGNFRDLDKFATEGRTSIVVFDKADKTDYMVAASCGILTGLLDSFWVGEFSLAKAQDWGRSKINSLVVKVAQVRGYSKDELEGAIKFLEKDAPMASDKLTNTWGGGLQHHFRDFAHHASIVGLVFSLLMQFTGKSYGTNTEGNFEIHELPDKALIGVTVEEKLFNGIVLWALHLVSDMAGSSNSAGKGTGIPGPILSLAKELSVLPGVKSLQFNYKGKSISISVMLSKIFNGTAFEHTSNRDLIKFDLRTEIGVYAYGVKQSIPVVINQCAIRAFYFVRRLCWEISNKHTKDIKDLRRLEPKYFLPRNNKRIRRMVTISNIAFCVVDTSDAAIRAYIYSSNGKREFSSKLLLRINFIGIESLFLSIKNDISINILQNNKGKQKSEIK